MKIIYISYARIPTEKAHGLQIVKMCEAFARPGVKVELVVPRRKNTISQNVFEYYRVEKNFRVSYLPHFDFTRFGRAGYYLSWLSFALAVFFKSIFMKADVFYFRDELSLLLLSFFKRTVIEVHDIPESFVSLYYFLIRRADFCVSTNNWKREQLVSDGKVPAEKITIAPNGIDLREFAITQTKKELRQNLGLPQDKKIALYVGSLEKWKGVGVLAESSRFLSGDVQVVFIGGSEKDVQNFRARHPDMRAECKGAKPHYDSPKYLKAADVLVLPNIPSSLESTYGTSPIKMFDYMASGTPIAASDLPSIREVLSERNALLVPAGDAKALAEGIEKLIFDKTLAEDLSKKAQEESRAYVWEKRAEKIIHFITHQKHDQ